jgi:hypothetical protein
MPEILRIPELGVIMQVPSALSAVTYQLQDTAAYTRKWTDQSGAHAATPVAVANLGSSQWNDGLPTSGACGVPYPAGTPEVVLSVWNLDPATLPGQDTSGLTPGATPDVGGRYFLLDNPRAGGSNACGNGQPYALTQADLLANQQRALFLEMVASVAAAS